MMKYVLVFNPKDNTKNRQRLNMDCYHIHQCLNGKSQQSGTGAKNVRKALQGIKRLRNFNANWFLYFNFSKIVDPNRKRPLAIQVTKGHSALFWSDVMDNLIKQLSISKNMIQQRAIIYKNNPSNI